MKNRTQSIVAISPTHAALGTWKTHSELLPLSRWVIAASALTDVGTNRDRGGTCHVAYVSKMSYLLPPRLSWEGCRSPPPLGRDPPPAPFSPLQQLLLAPSPWVMLAQRVCPRVFASCSQNAKLRGGWHSGPLSVCSSSGPYPLATYLPTPLSSSQRWSHLLRCLREPWCWTEFSPEADKEGPRASVRRYFASLYRVGFYGGFRILNQSIVFLKVRRFELKRTHISGCAGKVGTTRQPQVQVLLEAAVWDSPAAALLILLGPVPQHAALLHLSTCEAAAATGVLLSPPEARPGLCTEEGISNRGNRRILLFGFLDPCSF